MFRLSRRLLVVLGVLLSCFAAQAQTFSNVSVPVQGQFATLLQAQNGGFFKSGVGGNSVAYTMAIQPGTALTLYVTAKSQGFAGPTDQININFFANGNPTIAGCSNGGGYLDGWTPIVTSAFINATPTGVAGAVQHLSFGAPATAFVVSGILSAAQVCVQVINNYTGNANDLFDIYASFTPNALPTGASVGTSAVGIDCTGGLAMNTTPGVLQPVPCDNNGNSAGSAGFYLGSQTGNGLYQDLGNWLSIFHGNAGTQNGGLAVVTTAVDNTGHARTLGVAQNQQTTTGGSPPDGSLLTVNGGIELVNIGTTVTSNLQTVFSRTATQAIGGIARDCTFVQTITGTVTGTGPTLDTYIQDSPDNGTTWIDRVHFLQATAPGAQSATIISNPAAGIVPYVPTNQTLAVGTIINGPFFGSMRVAYVVGGTTPNFGGVNLYADCN